MMARSKLPLSPRHIAAFLTVAMMLLWPTLLHAQSTDPVTDPSAPGAMSAPGVTIVRPSALNGWSFSFDAPESTGGFVDGPALPPRGTGSVQLSISAHGVARFSTSAYATVRLTRLSRLTYHTYRSTYDPDNHTTLNLAFDIDLDADDGVAGSQARLVFEPYKTRQHALGVVQGEWQKWDALSLDSAWWVTEGPGSGFCSQDDPCTWQEVLKFFPRAQIAPGGQLMLMAGNPWRRGVTASADELVIGVGDSATLYDFEPEKKSCSGTCYVDAEKGSDSAAGDSPEEALRTIGAALDRVASGGTVIAAAGIYSEAVTLTKAVKLVGPNHGVCAAGAEVGAAGAVRQAEAVIAPIDGVAFTLAAGVDDVIIDGFTIAAPARSAVGTPPGSQELFERVTLQNNLVTDVRDAAVATGDARLADWLIACNRIAGAGEAAIVLGGSENRAITVRDNLLRGAGDDTSSQGIVLANGIDSIVKNNDISEVGGSAVALVDGAQRTTVADNRIVHVGDGIRLFAAGTATAPFDQVAVESNSIVDVRRSAVLVDIAEPLDGVMAHSISVTGNTVEQVADRLENDAALIDLRVLPSPKPAAGTITVRKTMLHLHGELKVASTHALRVRGAVAEVELLDNQFDGGHIGGPGLSGQPASSGIYIQTDDAGYGALRSNAVLKISGNRLSGFENGVVLFDPVINAYGGLATGAKVVATANVIAGNHQFGARSGEGETLAAADNWWGDKLGPAGVGPGAGDAVSDNVGYCTWLDAAPPSGAPLGFVRNVDSNRYFCTISSAIADETTQDGHTLVAAARTFTEQVSITKSISLTGAGIGDSIIRAPAAMQSSPAAAIVSVRGEGVAAAMTGFTVAGPGSSVCGEIRAGIFVYEGAHALLYGNEVVNIRNEPLMACPYGIGIAVGNLALGSSGSAEIHDNVITGYQKGGIVVTSPGSNAVIAGNMIEGAGATNVLVQNGVQVSFGAFATISGNTIDGHVYTPANLVSAGVLLYNADADTSTNVVSDNQVGIYLVDSSGTHDGNLVSATAGTVGAANFWGIIVDAPPPGRTPQPSAPGVTDALLSASLDAPGGAGQGTGHGIQRAIVRNNEFVSSGPGGIALQADGGYGTLDIDLTASNNDIRGWARGVNITQCSGDCSGAGYVSVVVRHNRIEADSVGLDNGSASGFGVDASENWWGELSGPATTRNPGGAGGVLSGDAHFAPWLCGGSDTDPAIGFQPDTSDRCGLAEQLTLLAPPVGGLQGFPLPQQPAIRIEDSHGNLAVNFDGPITIAAPGAILGGDTTISADNGIANFVDVSVETPADALALQISAPGLPALVSDPIVITPQTGELTVRVDVVGMAPADAWSVLGPTGETTVPATGGEYKLSGLQANETYTLSVTAKYGYAIEGLCTTGVSGEGLVSVSLAYQAEVTCTFVATAQPATVTLVQTVEGQKPAVDWEFGGDLGVFRLPAAGGQQQFTVPAGIYQVGASTRTSYSSSVACTNGAGGGATILLVLAPGDEVACTFTATVRTTSLALRKTVDVTADRCGLSDVVAVPAGTTVYYCYTILNTGEAPLSLHNLADSEAGNILANVDYTLQPGAAIDTVALGSIISETVSTSTVTAGVWTASTGEGPAAHDQATASVNVLRAAVDVALTVDREDVLCGVQNEVKLEKGSKVNYCITLRNSGEAPLSRHRVEAPGLKIVTEFEYPLAPGAFVRLTAQEIPGLGGIELAAEQRLTLTVHSTNPPAELSDAPKYLVAPELFAAEGTASAAVSLVQGGEDPTTLNIVYLPAVTR